MSSKNNYVVNPKTGRPIKIGGKVYNKMIKEGLISKSETVDENELGDLPEDYIEQVQKIDEIDQELPDGFQAVRGRGKYKNKIVKRSKALPVETTSRTSAKIACDVLKENKELLNDLNRDELEDDDIENLIEQLILDNLTNNSVLHDRKTKNTKTPKYKLEEWDCDSDDC